jgi:hypothetical protein
MPVTPTPQTIMLDLPEEYLDFLAQVSQVNSLSRQDVLREALTLLKDAKLSRAPLLELPTFANEHSSDLKRTCLAAWDRWSENQGQQLPLSDSLAAFVHQLIADGVAKDPTGVFMLALLRYAKVMDLLPREDQEG